VVINFAEYRKTAGEVGRLRTLTILWRKTDGFWTFDQTLDALSRSGAFLFYGAEGEEAPWRIAVLCDIGPFSVDLLYVYCDPTYRRTGLARDILQALRGRLKDRGQSLEFLHLEVRATNVAAQSLYRSLGMEEVGLRKSYYADGEDALTFRWSLKD